MFITCFFQDAAGFFREDHHFHLWPVNTIRGHGANEGRGHHQPSQRPLSGGALVKGKRQSNSTSVWCFTVSKREIDGKLLLRSSFWSILRGLCGEGVELSVIPLYPKDIMRSSVCMKACRSVTHHKDADTILNCFWWRRSCTSWCRRYPFPVFMLAQSSPFLNAFHKAVAHCSRINL